MDERQCAAIPEMRCSDPCCASGSDDGCRYEMWLRDLDEGVIQGEYGYEDGEFSVFPSHWLKLYSDGHTPEEAWLIALAAHGEQQRATAPGAAS